METEIRRIKQYNSSYKYVLSIDGEPVVCSKSEKRISELQAYVLGYDVTINDGKVKKILDDYRVKKG